MGIKSIIQKWLEIKPSKPETIKERRTKALELYSTGMPTKTISEITGIHRTHVSKLANRHGMRRRAKPMKSKHPRASAISEETAIKLIQCIEQRLEGRPWGEIQDVHGRSVNWPLITVKRIEDVTDDDLSWARTKFNGAKMPDDWRRRIQLAVSKYSGDVQ